MKRKEEVYECYSHCKTRMRYHIILTTKYRRKCLDSIKDQVLETFKYKDHIHLLVSFPPQYSISQTINCLKQCTTNYLYREYEPSLRRFYWKKKRVLWSDSYFCSTIGTVSEEKVTSYIENQGF